MTVHVTIIGYLLVVLALAHIVFPTYFNWRKELEALSLVNKQIMQVHTFFIALTVFLMGILCITSATEIIQTSIGRKISLGLGIFWAARLFIQFFGYSSKLWKGKTFETIIHILFSICWMYITFVFLRIYFAI
jgi:hypothetical protein